MGLLKLLFKKISNTKPTFTSYSSINDKVMEINLKNAKQLNTDLVEADYFKGCCGECAKYRGRWFSISGNDKRFPKMPVDYGCTCEGIDFSPVIYGASEPCHCPKGKNIIEFSNSPFVDNRTKKEKEMHQHFLDSEVYDKIKEQDKIDYEKLVKAFQNDMPKSFSAYRRMKISETNNFLKIAEKAESIGLEIKLSKEDRTIIERYNDYEKNNN